MTASLRMAYVAAALRFPDSAEHVRVRSAHRGEAAARRPKLREPIEPVEDQVRLYPLPDRTSGQVAVIRAQVIQDARISGS